MLVFDEDAMNWVLTPTALFRVNAPPVFLAPHLWPKHVWKGCC